MAEFEGDIKQLILWISILIMTVLVFNVFKIVVWKFFTPPTKDLSDRVIDKLFNALNSENIASLVPKGDSGRYTSNGTTPSLKGDGPKNKAPNDYDEDSGSYSGLDRLVRSI